jgi:RNA-directed DNA polymerase
MIACSGSLPLGLSPLHVPGALGLDHIRRHAQPDSTVDRSAASGDPPVVMPDGDLVAEEPRRFRAGVGDHRLGLGQLQLEVIAQAPVLANLFMHFAFDSWMAREFPGCPFERYADDAVVHCKSRRQSEYVRARIAARMQEVGLRLHPDKTKIVYCKDSNRREEHEHTSLTFLGYAFRPREARRKDGKKFTSFLPAISPEALKAKCDRLRELRIHRHTNLSLDDLAGWLNPIVAGWMNYYGGYYRSALYPLLQRVSIYLRRWAGKKYKRLRTYKRFKRWWAGLLDRAPSLFAHWRWVRWC